MAENSSLITSLKSLIPETSWPWVIPALKHDPIFWESLLDPEFFDTTSNAISKPRDWSPSLIAALSLECSNLKATDKETIQEGETKFDEFIQLEDRSSQERMSLKLAAQIALAMYARYEDNFLLLIEDLFSEPNDTSRWVTPLAIYFGLIPDQTECLIALIHKSLKNNLIPTAIHAVLCQPIPQEEQQQLLEKVLAELSLHETTSVLSSLNKYRPSLALELANEWLDNHHQGPSNLSSQSSDEKLSQLTEILLNAEMYSLAHRMDRAERFKSQSLNIISGLHEKISNELVGETLQARSLEQSLSLWTSISIPSKLTPPASLIIELLKSGRLDDSMSLLPEMEGSSQTPIRWLNNIYQALNNEDIPQARLFAHQALNSFIENFESNPESLEHNFGSQQDILAYLAELIHQLTNLAMYKEAYQAAILASLIKPGDPEVLMTVTKTGRSAGDYEISIEAAELGAAIEPTNPEYRRQLALSLEAAGFWSKSLGERQAILEHRFAQSTSPSWPTSEDLLALANCSIHADQPQKAFDVCQKAIDLDPSNGQAHALIGEALTSLGEVEQALEHFNLATQLAPHKASPWLSLANAHRRAGQMEKSIETLRTASHAVPDDPALFYELGQVYIDENSPSQAQSAFARAYQLVSEPNSATPQNKSKNEQEINVEQITHNREQLCEIALSYGKILEHLGHAEQAHQVFEKAYQSYPSYPGLAYIYAKSMMDMGEEREAIAPLAIAVAVEPTGPQPYIEYARILLLAQENPGEAVQSIQRALQILENLENNSSDDYSEERDLATALLAQAQEASGELQNALLTYSQALETDLGGEETWRTDLAIGMGRVALRLDQPEVAIAALQDTDRDEIQNTEIAQILCDAYSAISLKQEALFAARTAVHLAPDDIEILSWFADRATELGVIAEAIPALTRAAQLAPKRTDLIIRLGQVFARMEKEDEAKEAFLSALSSPYSKPEDLYKAADGLSDLGEDDSAADCLERALELQPQPPLNLILELASAYSAAGKTELAIKTIDKGVDQDPENALLHTYKAELLCKLDRQQAAQACLEHALILEPENPYVQLQIAYVLRDQGELISAFEHARIASESLKPEIFALSAKGLVAELARSTLQEDIIQEVLESPIPQDSKIESIKQTFFGEPTLFDYYCIIAEYALENEEQIASAAALNEAYLLDPEHPRVLALQSRLALRQGDRDSALKSLDAAIDKVKDPDLEETFDHIQPNSLLGIALSAIELYKWDLANEYLDDAASICQHDANIQLQKTRLFVLRAEFQRLCLSLDIVNHAPGTVALSPRTYRIFEESLQETIDCLPGDLQVEHPALIRRWRIRGEVAFHPDVETIKSLEIETLGASDQAAVLQAIAQQGDISATARLYHSIQSNADSETLHHCVYAAYALALSSTGKDQIALEQAQEAIQYALEQNQTEAIYYVIQAKIAEKLGDWQVSLNSMATALTLWSNEPRWQSYIGQIYRLNDDFPEAIAHFEKAIEMESNFLQHYIDLSQAHLIYGQASEAISVLRQALRIAPEQVEPYLALANAQYEIQDYTQAMKNAQLAANIAPDEQIPLLISAKIAVKMGDPGKAKTYAESALRIDPDSPEALHLQAQALFAAGNAERALNIVEKAIPLSKDPLPLLLQRAEMLSQLEGPEANLAALQSIADEYPDEPIVLAPFAEALADSGNDPEAIQSAQQALHRSSGQLPLDEQAKLHNLLGSLLQQSGQLDQSIHHLSEAIRIAPSTMDSYLNLGSTQAERRQYEQALETYQKAIRIHPSDPRPYHQAGLLLKASRDYPAAEKMLRRAAEKAPDDVAIHRQLAAMVALNLVHNRQPVSSEI